MAVPSLPVEHPTRSSVRGLITSYGIVLLLVVLMNAVISRHALRSGFELVNRKWLMLERMDKPADWLVLGDSHGLNGIVPSHLEARLGGTALNLSTHAGLLKLSDAWMLQEHIRRIGPPKQVVVITAFRTWYMEFEGLSPQVMSKIPLRWGFWNRMEPQLHLDRQGYTNLVLGRFVPLYSSNQTIGGLLMNASKRSARFAAQKGEHITVGAMKTHAEVSKQDLAAGYVEITKAEDPAEGAVEARVRKWVRLLGGRPATFSKYNADCLRVMTELAEKYKFPIYFVNGPVVRDLYEHPEMKVFFDSLDQQLAQKLAGHANTHYLPGYYVFEPSEGVDEGHLRYPGACAYSDWVAGRVAQAGGVPVPRGANASR